MSKTVCIAFGIANYEDNALSTLLGAKADAERVFDVLLNSEIVESDSTLSSVHYDVSRDEARKIIADVAYNPEIDTLSIYFAGHGGSSNSGYFLCCKDCDTSKMAYSALSLSDIFTILSSSPKKHVNLIIDACNAGGLAQDLSAISKNSHMGATSGISISIIALSSKDESSFENASGGFGTTAFLEVIKGERDSQSNKEYLSLGDVHQALEMQHSNQTPSYWSFNSTGTPRFCKNVYAAKNRKGKIFTLPKIDEVSTSTISSEARDLIWKSYLEIASELEPRRLQVTLERILGETLDDEEKVSLLLGLLDSFLERSRNNEDLFAPIYCASVFLFVTSNVPSKTVECAFLTNVLLDELKKALHIVAKEMQDDEYFLVRESGGHSDFFTLPQRISNIAAWAILAVHLDQVLNDGIETMTKICQIILDKINDNYSSSFELMSESQSPAILVISTLSKLVDRQEWADDYLAHLYFSYSHNNGKVARTNLDNDLAFDFIRHRLLEEKANFEKFCARPTEVLLSLLSHYWKQNTLEVIRYDFKDLDGVSINGYVPENYNNFSEEQISAGRNLGVRIGFDVFTSQDLKAFIENHLIQAAEAAVTETDDQQLLTAIIASLIYPDRLPWFLLSQ